MRGIGPESVNLSGLLHDSAVDSACYAAKDRGRNRVHVYQPDDQALAQHKGDMYAAIAEAIHRIGRVMSLKTIAQAVEDTPTLEALRGDRRELRSKSRGMGIAPPRALNLS